MNKRRRLIGVVISDKMEKTVVVKISRTYRHPLFRKVVHATHKVYAHDLLNCKIGDQVQIVECAPISKLKSWTVEAILTHDEAAATPLAEGE